MSEKNCLLVFRNKKLNFFKRAEQCISSFASNGIYFDRIIYVSFDDASEITHSLTECLSGYGQVIILSPQAMYASLVSFCEKTCGGTFDSFNILSVPQVNVYIILTDGESRLKESDVISVINKKSDYKAARAYIKTVGASLSEINSAIYKAKEICPLCDFNVSEHYSEGRIEIIFPETVLKSDFDNMWRTMISGLNDYIYALEDISLAERLFQLLQLRRMKISVAESFTGGGIAKKLVGIPGISEVYFEGLNTYSNESKMKRLGVDELILKQYGAVSEQTAYQMAEGLLRTGDCDISVATTGIAGPKSDNTLKPVGLLYIAVGTRESISVFKYELKGGRENITETAINLALFHTFKKVK